MSKRLHWAIPVAADATAVLALFLLLPLLANSFAAPSGLNALWLVLSYIWFAASVLIIRKQRAVGDNPASIGQKVRIGLALLFAAGLSLAISHQLGYLDTMLEVNPRELGAGESAAFFVLAPGAWLGFSLLYVIFLGFHVRDTAQSSPWLIGFSLLGINATAVLAAAEIRVVLDLFGIEQPLSFLLGLGMLILFVGPPRLIHLRKQSVSWPQITFLGFLFLAAILV